jgi:hypothetical protein
MKWVLLFIDITGSSSFAVDQVGRYDSMIECFGVRDEVLVKLDAYNERPPLNTQLVCVKTEYE